MDLSAWELFLPSGMLDYFEVSSATQTEDRYTIYLTEKNLYPGEFSGSKLLSKGFLEPITIKDFPIRGKACYLEVKRRRWLNKELNKVVSRDWQLVAEGTRMTNEFASFLKEVHRYHTSKL